LHLDDVHVFERIVSLGSISAAARELRVSPSAISRRLQALENRLGVRLVTRTSRILRTTEAGDRFHRRCRTLLEALREAENEVTEQATSVEGRIRVSAPMSFGRRKLAPLVSAFRRLHPRVELDLSLSDVTDSLSRDEFDLALVIGEPRGAEWVTRRLVAAVRRVVASPGYLLEHGAPATPGELANRPCLVLMRDGQPLDQWRFTVDGRDQIVEVSGALRCNNGEIINEWAEAGLGLAYKSSWDVDPEIAANRLVEVLADFRAETADLFVLFPDRHNLPQRTRVFLDFMLEQLRLREA
jgi:LysR family transcriptional regulator, transcriptional activator for dmlA